MTASLMTAAERVNLRWGESLAKARRDQKVTQAGLAKLVHLDQTTVSRYEKGRAPWTPGVMIEFALALGTTVDRLFSWPEGIEEIEKYRRQVSAA